MTFTTRLFSMIAAASVFVALAMPMLNQAAQIVA